MNGGGLAWSRAMALGVGLALGLAGRASFAEPASPEVRAGARAAAERGGAEYKAGHYKQALDLFLRAESLIHAPTHLLMIARTHAALGELVLAKESYLKITREELAPNAPPPFKKAVAEGEKELTDLEPKIPSLELSVKGGAAAKGLVVTMDGLVVPAALVGIARPVDPGTHVVRATAEGLESPERSVTAKEGDKLAVVLELHAGAPVVGGGSRVVAPAGGGDTGATAPGGGDTGATPPGAKTSSGGSSGA